MRDLAAPGPAAPAGPDPLAALAGWAGEGRALVLATVIETWGSAPCPAGSHLVIESQGGFAGSVSGGCVEGAVIAAALAMLETGGGARMLDFGVSQETAWAAGLSCGGRIRVGLQPVTADLAAAVRGRLAARAENRRVISLADFAGGGLRLLSPPEEAAMAAAAAAARATGRPVLLDGARLLTLHLPPAEIVVAGAVHVAQVLGGLAALSGLGLRIVDPRSAFAAPGRFFGFDLTADWPQEALAARPLHERSALVALTHDPKIDDPAIRAGLAAGAFYVGALGSRSTHSARIARLAAAGVAGADLARIRGPIGLPIGAEGPAEIAVAILAEVIAALRRRDGGWPLRRPGQPG